MPLTSGLEAPEPEVTFTLELPQGPPVPATGPAIPVDEVTGIGPPPVAELRPPSPGTIPEPSSLWLLALGLGVAWRSRRR
ncbi:MAG: PEP-CTERM sorting domain-containing protein [Rubrivivax sp.]|nr:PEP-CTERM sorting domain-containing protein [Rubrivivax sp.]